MFEERQSPHAPGRSISVSEAYIVIDERDDWIPVDTDPLKIDVVEQYLADVTGTPSQKISITTLGLPNATVGTAYDFALQAQGGTEPYNWTCNAQMPPGLTLNTNGTISGVPTGAMIVSNMLFTVTDSVGNGSGVILSITINPASTPSTCKVGNGVAGFLNIYSRLANRRGRFQ